MAYELVWSKQVGVWLVQRSKHCQAIDLGVKGGHLENAHLIVCSGWR
jgi:hypothetical protein